MLHRTPLPRLSSTFVVLLGLIVSLVTPAAAHALSRPSVDLSTRTVRLVQNTDGSLDIVTGAVFSTADADATVLIEEADVAFHTTLVDAEDLDADGLITDDHRADQWNLDMVQAETAWARADGEGQIIAIIDSGVDGTHPDLQDRLVPGFSAINADELVDGHGHGTHVAGTAAASIGQDFGVAGLAYAANIMPIQVTDANGLGYASDVARGLLWAVDHGATVANLSLAGTQASQVLNAAIDYAVHQGVVVVVAAGNEYLRDNPRTYPAAHPRVLTVAALRNADVRSSFSSTGDFVDIAAPGSSILSDRPGDTFGYSSGTSMAAPLVAGAAALLRSVDPDLTVEEIMDALTDSATDLGSRGRDDEFGHGAINLLAALDAVGAPTPVIPEPAVVLDPTPVFDEETSNLDGDAPGLAVDPITQQVTDGSWVSLGWGL